MVSNDKLNISSSPIITSLLRRINTLLFFLLLMFSFIKTSPLCAEQEPEYISFDYSDSLKDYVREVARYNRLWEEGEDIFIGSENSQQNNGISKVSQNEDEEEKIIGAAVLCKTDGRELEKYEDGLICLLKGPKNSYTLYYDSLKKAEEAVAFLREREGIIYAELDGEVEACSDSEYETNDPSASFRSWGAEQMHYRDYLEYASRCQREESVVAVIDSGVYPHSMIEPKIIAAGYDYVDLDEDPTNDTFGHGTNVAGIIADCTGDLPVLLYPIRVLNSGGGGKISNVINAIEEARAEAVDVINLSLSTTIVSQALDMAILDALTEGISVVVAAGNNNCDTVNIYPAHMTDCGVIVVGSVDVNGEIWQKASYSNYGESVDIYSYGTDILCCSRTGDYVHNSGTSMATPHISAACALLRLIHPQLAPDEIEYRLLSGSILRTEMPVLDLAWMIPQSEGFCLNRLCLKISEEIPMPEFAFPLSACEMIEYESSQPTVACVENGLLTGKQAGSTQISAVCTGFETVCFDVMVEE